MIFCYARVSTTEQAADGTTSIEEQIRKCRAVAHLRGVGPFDVADYTDKGVSGSIPLAQRDAGRDMLAAASHGDTICAAKMDRLFRSASDALTTAEELKKKGVDLILIDMGVEPVTANGVSKMFFGMLALVAEFERERIAERMADGRKGKRQKDGHVGGLAPYGFRVEGKGREARLVAEPAEQAAITKVLELTPRFEPSSVLRILTRDGYRDRAGKPFNFMQVKRIVAYHRRLEVNAAGHA